MNSVPFFAKTTEVVETRGLMPQPGAGVHLSTNELGTTYAVPPGTGYRWPFKCLLGAGVVQIRPGLVDGFTPKIGGQPMTAANVLLKLDAGKANARGESWIVLEVEPDAAGVLTPESRIEIVQRAVVNRHEPAIGRQPLALILFKDRRPQRVLPITHFNLRYYRVTPPPGLGAVRHLFL